MKLWNVHLQWHSPSPSCTQYSHHTVTTAKVVTEDVVSCMLLSPCIFWLEAGGHFGLSLCNHRHNDEVCSQCWNSAVQSLSGFWMHRWLACNPGDLPLAPFWMHLTVWCSAWTSQIMLRQMALVISWFASNAVWSLVGLVECHQMSCHTTGVAWCFCWDPLDSGITSWNHLVSSQKQFSWPIQCTLWPLWWCLATVVYQALLCRLASRGLLFVTVSVVLACSLPSAGCDILHQEVFLPLWTYLHTPSAGILLW